MPSALYLSVEEPTKEVAVQGWTSGAFDRWLTTTPDDYDPTYEEEDEEEEEI